MSEYTRTAVPNAPGLGANGLGHQCLKDQHCFHRKVCCVCLTRMLSVDPQESYLGSLWGKGLEA